MCLHELGLYFSFISCFSFVIFSFVCKKKNAKVGPKIQPIEANFFSGNLQMEPNGPSCAHL